EVQVCSGEEDETDQVGWKEGGSRQEGRRKEEGRGRKTLEGSAGTRWWKDPGEKGERTEESRGEEGCGREEGGGEEGRYQAGEKGGRFPGEASQASGTGKTGEECHVQGCGT
ncbi:MAG TPA: hypothetical protein PKN30_11995, partial [Flavobacteriales bacterium]|nr:hypothetical protein [Flavobacteriales bacterium]